MWFLFLPSDADTMTCLFLRKYITCVMCGVVVCCLYVVCVYVGWYGMVWSWSGTVWYGRLWSIRLDVRYITFHAMTWHTILLLAIEHNNNSKLSTNEQDWVHHGCMWQGMCNFINVLAGWLYEKAYVFVKRYVRWDQYIVHCYIVYKVCLCVCILSLAGTGLVGFRSMAFKALRT